MKNDSVIDDPAPLQTSYRPSSFVDRESEREQINQIQENQLRNLFLHGPRGTGKTHLLLDHIEKLPSSINTCYIPCRRCSTQYQALKQIYQSVTGENPGDGHHTAKLQREIQDRTTDVETLIVLDDVDFLLSNDGDSLLYKLSRTNPENLSIVIISSQTTDLSQRLEERTYSSLQPSRIGFEPYSAGETYQVLGKRARDSLKPETLHRNALTYIASTTQNISKGLTWLKTSAKNTEDRITEESVRQTQRQAYQDYVSQQLRYFTQHHRLLHQAIEELEEEHGTPINTGKIYDRYQELCKSESVSNRRLSDFLKDLELLDLVEAKYHYGGRKGKTREIKSSSF
ncbi:Cdc6/Cdc18 family protein [Halosimplex salinum]|uniref:Cdc6/Cdc18 family protein n=1 Tax=Halosimplex salinum TaxID=1710538 RepID=UPI000F495523|nr:AAA family ATPase [Halosimplex salinum]